MKDSSFVSSVKAMGFEDMGGGEFLRFEGNGRVFAMNIDEDEDICVDGIREFENYGEECHEQLVSYERYITSEADLIVYLKEHNVSFDRNKEELKDVVSKLQKDLYKALEEKDDTNRAYAELGKMVDKETLAKHLENERNRNIKSE